MEYDNKVECIPNDISTPIRSPYIFKHCIKLGARPDPLDCTHFIYCRQHFSQIISDVNNCPSGTVYDIPSEKCKIDGSCSTIHSHCTENEDKLVAYPPYPSLYVKCPAVNSTDDPIVNLCKDGRFNDKIGTCESICKQEGNIPNHENCKTFYKCTKINNDLFNISLYLCPAGTGFDPKTKVCEESKSSC